MTIHNAKNAINGTYYVKLFQESDIDKKYEGSHDCYFFVEKEVLNRENIKKENVDEFILSLFNKKYDSKKYMKDVVNIIHSSPESKDDIIFINSLKEDFNFKKTPNSINIKKY